MIEEIKKEVEHCFDGVYLEDKNFIIKTIIKILDKYATLDAKSNKNAVNEEIECKCAYKNAWEEFKDYYYIQKPSDEELLKLGKIYKKIYELEQKYNLDKENI